MASWFIVVTVMLQSHVFIRFIFVFSVIKYILTKLGPLLTTHLLQPDQTDSYGFLHISEWWWWVCVHTGGCLFCTLHLKLSHFDPLQQTHTLHIKFIFSLSIVFMISVIYKLLCLSCSATLPEAFHDCINWNPKHPRICGNSRNWWTSDWVLWQQQQAGSKTWHCWIILNEVSWAV